VILAPCHFGAQLPALSFTGTDVRMTQHCYDAKERKRTMKMKMKMLFAALPAVFLVFAVAPYAGADTLGDGIAKDLCFTYQDGATYSLLAADNGLYGQVALGGTYTQSKPSGKAGVTTYVATFKKEANQAVGRCCLSMQFPNTTSYASSQVTKDGFVLSTPHWGPDPNGVGCQ